MKTKLYKLLTLICLVLLLGSCVSNQIVKSPVETRGTINRNSEILENGKSKYISIFSINDLHGTVEEDLAGKNPGIAKLYQVLTELQNANPESIFVSAGDNYQGSALSNMSSGKVVSDFFKLAGLSASTIGNHEFDWSTNRIALWKKDGGFPFVAANIIDKSTGEIPYWAKPYVLYNVGGHLVAVIGLATPDTVNSVKAEMIANYEFADPAKTAKVLVSQLKATYNPDCIIALTHIGSSINRLAPKQPISTAMENDLEELAKVRGLDAIITGHSHEIVNGKLFGTPIVQAGNYGRAICQLKIKFSESGIVSVKSSVVDVAKDKAKIPENAEALKIVSEYNRKYGSQLGEKLAILESELSHEELVPNITPMGYFVCDMLQKRYNVDIAMMNGGGIRCGFLPGNVTVKDMWNLLPFDNTVVIVKVKGKDLKQIISHGIDSIGFRAGQFAGGVVNYSSARSALDKVVSITLNDGRVVEDEEVYTLATNDFVYEGGDLYTMIKTSAIEANNTYEPIREVLIEETRKLGVITPKPYEVLISE